METRNYNRRYAKEYGFGRSLFYKLFVIFVVMPAAKLQYNIKIEGKENIDKHKKYLFTANHTSYLDPPFVALAANKKIAFMAKQELFTDKNWLLRHLVRVLGAFAVNRERPELATFKTVLDLIKTDWSLGIFPEGKICKTNSLDNIQKGFTLIAKKAKMDIVPIGIAGFDGYAGKSLFKKHITVKIGKPISYELPSEEILKQWAEQICEYTGYTNNLELKSEEKVNA
ncbi:TPA: 1-acyl-sn-glycerol-3-phosphate acyltransferase [Candidatus Gastranaerophilales bacterium HUM_9]|nr:MAG TPA: 1-acyl-sn-glycerol-3-phosphate acyltransferase [Candidatus Gastranaerophilales bacterium HUM_9]HBX35398.1 1-acyl-sn-glycerol-3-phosphate acyltransferase [Cyanobacteria bacterium UBA11440]